MAFLMRRRRAPWFPGTTGTKSVASHEGDDDDTLGSSSWTIASHESDPWESLDDANIRTQKGHLANTQWWRGRLRRECDEESFKSEMRARISVVGLGFLIAMHVYNFWNYPRVPASRDLRGCDPPPEFGPCRWRGPRRPTRQGPRRRRPSSLFFLFRLTFMCIIFWIAAMVWISDSFRQLYFRRGHKWFAVQQAMIRAARFLGIMSLDAAGVASDAARMSAVLRNNQYWTAFSLSGFPCGLEAGCDEDRFGLPLFRGYEATILAIIAFSIPIIDESLSFQGNFWVCYTMSLVATFHLVGASAAAVSPFATAFAASGLGNVVLGFYLKPLWCRAQQRLEKRLGQLENEKERLEWEKRILESDSLRFEELGPVPEHTSDSSSSTSLTPSERLLAMFPGDAVLPNQEL